MTKRIFTVLLAALLLMSCLAVAAEAGHTGAVDWNALELHFGAPDSAAFVRLQQAGGTWSLFLPAGDRAQSSVFCTLPEGVVSVALLPETGGSCELSGETPIDLRGILPGDRTGFTLAAELEDGSTLTANAVAYRSDTIDALFFNSDDPAEHGRTWVEASPTKENKASGAIVVMDAEGGLSHADAVDALKGRGNTTWKNDKRPYQIKLSKKDDLLDTGNKDNKAKKWLLLANYADGSLLRNSLALGLGSAMGMEYGVEFKPVDLFYDGEYRGSYLLTEKVEIGKGRVNIYELEAENEAANEGTDLETLPVETGKTENGAYYRYCEGMNTPEDCRHGYLMEIEMAYRLVNEVCWVQTRRGNCLVIKSPEFCSREEMDYVATWYQEYEDACYSDDGNHPETGRRYTDYVDLSSTVQFYLVNELSKNTDGLASSAFLYLASENEPAKMGPLWDYDLCFGRFGESVSGPAIDYQRDPTGFYQLYGILVNNWYRQPDFRAEVRAQYAGMYELLRDVALGDETQNAAALRSIAGMQAQISASRACNAVLWGGGYEASDGEDLTALLRDYVAARAEDLRERFAQWETDPPQIGVFLDVPLTAWFAEELGQAVRQGIVRGTAPQFFTPAKPASRRNAVQTLFNMIKPGSFETTTEFTDVRPDDSGSFAISWAAAAGITRGYPDGSFRPNEMITRAELVTFLYRMFDQPAVSADELGQFTDANTIPAYARTAMAWAIEAGVIRGYKDGTVKPRANTTRAEMAVIILRAKAWKDEAP